jgi:hypothetical protein
MPVAARLCPLWWEDVRHILHVDLQWRRVIGLPGPMRSHHANLGSDANDSNYFASRSESATKTMTHGENHVRV